MVHTTQTQLTYDFALVNAFSRTTFGGNPALVVILPGPFADESTYTNIAKNFNQPIACFVLPRTGRLDSTYVPGPDENPETTVTFALRWFSTKGEIPLCGHGTLATVHALFEMGIVPQDTRVLRFETMYSWFIARRKPGNDITGGDQVEIEIPAFEREAVSAAEFDRVRGVVNRAFGKEVDIQYVGIAKRGNKDGSERYILIEVNEADNLGGTEINTAVFTENLPHDINILTAASSETGVSYVTRMFAPAVDIQEDHVCGSANCLMAPYWADKLGIPSGQEMYVKQVSARGGDIWVTVDMQREKVKLSGGACLTTKGQVYL